MGAKQKRELRQGTKRVLSNLDPRWMKAAGKELCNRLSDLIEREYPACKHILAWNAFFPGEVDLTPFIEAELDKRAIYLPRVLPDNSMRFIQISRDWAEHTEQGVFGVTEPVDGSGREFDSNVDTDTIILVPGLAFDNQGNRLGRGKGCYDYFMGKPSMSSMIKIGVCWSLQIQQQVPIESHDVLMDWVCHEDGVIRTLVEFAEDL